MEQNRIFDIIISLVEGIKNNDIFRDDFCDEEIALTGCRYLLNKIIRQYKIPTNHYFVSEKAFDLWTKINSGSIFDYWDRKKVVKNISGEVFIDKYKNREKVPYQKGCLLKYGDTFAFNDVFTDEHIVTVNEIIKELINLPKCDYLSIKSVLDKIYICKVLKEEDRNIKNQINRSSLDYREIIAFDYNEAGIKVKDFDLKNSLNTLINECKKELEHLNK